MGPLEIVWTRRIHLAQHKLLTRREGGPKPKPRAAKSPFSLIRPLIYDPSAQFAGPDLVLAMQRLKRLRGKKRRASVGPSFSLAFFSRKGQRLKKPRGGPDRLGARE